MKTTIRAHRMNGPLAYGEKVEATLSWHWEGEARQTHCDGWVAIRDDGEIVHMSAIDGEVRLIVCDDAAWQATWEGREMECGVDGLHVKYAAMCSEGGGIFGHWGVGDSVDESIEACRKAVGKPHRHPLVVTEFSSDLPFAPKNREAFVHEADAWIGRDGSLNWIRCERRTELKRNVVV